MSQTSFTMVMTLRRFTHHMGEQHDNLERFLRLGMPTYEKYLNTEGLQEFFVITPSADTQGIREILKAKHPRFPWTVISEDVLVSKEVPPGWAKQQTSKLAVAALVKTDIYLIVDDDTYLTKPFGQKDLTHNGKIVLNKTQIDFPFFFLWSAQVLGVDFDKVQDYPTYMAITPEIFKTSVVRDIIKVLETKYGDRMQWQKALAENKYTEYCLYWIYLIDKEMASTLYALEDDAPQLYGSATTGPEHKMVENVATSFKQNDKFWFSFVQSSLEYSVSEIEAAISQHCC